MRKSLIFSLLSLLSIGSYAQPGPWSFSLAPGYATPMGSTSDGLKGSASLDGLIQYDLNPYFSAGLELGYIFSSKYEGVTTTINGTQTGTIDFTSDIHASMLHGTPELKAGYPFEWNQAKVKPYAVAGGGYYWAHFPAGTVTIPAHNATGHIGSNDMRGGGFNVGGGVDLDFGSNWGAGLDIRYHRLLQKSNEDLQFLIPSLKVLFHF